MDILFIIALFKTLSEPLGISYKVKHNLKIFLNIYLVENLVALPVQNKIQVFSENPCLLSIRIIRRLKPISYSNDWAIKRTSTAGLICNFFQF